MDDSSLAIYILEKLIEQGGCSSLEDWGTCSYRGENGRKCAAGHLIPDEKYMESMEGKNILMKNFGYDFPNVNRLTLMFLVRLHDQIANAEFSDTKQVSEFKRALEIFKSNDFVSAKEKLISLGVVGLDIDGSENVFALQK